MHSKNLNGFDTFISFLQLLSHTSHTVLTTNTMTKNSNKLTFGIKPFGSQFDWSHVSSFNRIVQLNNGQVDWIRDCALNRIFYFADLSLRIVFLVDVENSSNNLK